MTTTEFVRNMILELGTAWKITQGRYGGWNLIDWKTSDIVYTIWYEQGDGHWLLRNRITDHRIEAKTLSEALETLLATIHLQIQVRANERSDKEQES